MSPQNEIRELKRQTADQAQVIDRQRADLDRCAGVAAVLIRVSTMLEGVAQDIITATTGMGPTGQPIA